MQSEANRINTENVRKLHVRCTLLEDKVKALTRENMRLKEAMASATDKAGKEILDAIETRTEVKTQEKAHDECASKVEDYMTAKGIGDCGYCGKVIAHGAQYVLGRWANNKQEIFCNKECKKAYKWENSPLPKRKASRSCGFGSWPA